MEDNYPTEEQLKTIESWAYEKGFDKLLEFVDGVFIHLYGRFEKKGDRWELATGGWSGNEVIVMALRNNLMFWAMYWESSHRGGLHVFEKIT